MPNSRKNAEKYSNARPKFRSTVPGGDGWGSAIAAGELNRVLSLASWCTVAPESSNFRRSRCKAQITNGIARPPAKSLLWGLPVQTWRSGPSRAALASGSLFGLSAPVAAFPVDNLLPPQPCKARPYTDRSQMLHTAQSAVTHPRRLGYHSEPPHVPQRFSCRFAGRLSLLLS
jgi:hypothetical protein